MTTQANREVAGFHQRGWAVCLAAAVAALAAARASAIELDTARELDPPLGSGKVAPTLRFSPRLLPLWLEALARPESDLKRQAADAIAKAHRLGMPGLAEAVPPLLKELEAPGAPLVVRLAVARTLIALDARQTADVLMRHAQADGFDAARLLEPVLARWNYAPMRQVWLACLESPQTPLGLLLLAIQAATLTKLGEAAPHLHRLALDRKVDRGVRLEAARSLAALQPTGLEAEARRLVESAGRRDVSERVIAATLLTHHRGAESEALLLQLASDEEPAVAVVAGGRLAEIGPDRVKPLLERLIASSDSRLRQLSARVLADLRTPEAVAQLSSLLDDRHRELRIAVRESLIRLADMQALTEPVQQASMRMLNAKRPRANEQAAMVVGAIRHKPAADQLVQLLDSGAFEVRVAAAWALRRLAVPATAAAILKRVEVETARVRQDNPFQEEPRLGLFQDLENLIEALGVLHYRPAHEVLKKYLPPPPLRPPFIWNPIWQNNLRAAAFWSLGHIYADDPQAELAAYFRDCLTPDAESVRVMAAVGIGRMKAKDQTPALRQMYEDDTALITVRRACAWSLQQLTGTPVKMPEPRPRTIWSTGWFLEPLKP
jgi:HEAT repeat protein